MNVLNDFVSGVIGLVILALTNVGGLVDVPAPTAGVDTGTTSAVTISDRTFLQNLRDSLVRLQIRFRVDRDSRGPRDDEEDEESESDRDDNDNRGRGNADDDEEDRSVDLGERLNPRGAAALEIEADVFTDITTVKVELNDTKTEFTTSATTRAAIVDRILAHFPTLTRTQVEASLDLKVDGRASQPKDLHLVNDENSRNNDEEEVGRRISQ